MPKFLQANCNLSKSKLSNCAKDNTQSMAVSGISIRTDSTEPFSFQAFYPGPGVCWHFTPIDPDSLSDHVKNFLGRPFAPELLDLGVEVSYPDLCVRNWNVDSEHGIDAGNRLLTATQDDFLKLLGLGPHDFTATPQRIRPQ